MLKDEDADDDGHVVKQWGNCIEKESTHGLLYASEDTGYSKE